VQLRGPAQEPALASIPEKNILHIMLRPLKKWRLVRRLRKECLGHIGKQGDGFVLRAGAVWASKGAFAQQTMEHFWRSRFWSEEHKIEKLHQIHSLLDSCIAEKFIDDFLHEDGSRRFIKTSLAGEDFCDFTDFLEFCMSKYRSVATNIIIPIVTFALGFFGPSIVKKLAEKPPQKVYQAPTPAEVAQVTSPLKTQDQSSKGQNTGTSGANSTSGKLSHKEPKPAAPSASPPPMRLDCGGGNCAQSSGQTGGITAGTIINPPAIPPEVQWTQENVTAENNLRNPKLYPHWQLGAASETEQKAIAAREAFATNPGVIITGHINDNWPSANFAAICDRPCENLVALLPNGPGWSEGYADASDTMKVLIFVQPTSLAPGTHFKWEIHSRDENPVKIVGVKVVNVHYTGAN
jgi:hypothetical protein